MILRDFASCRETVDDIQQITEKRRYIFIFKYESPLHFGLNYACDNLAGNYDLYLINESVIHGVDYHIPKGITLFNRNTYRGSVKYPFDVDGKLNPSSPVIFYSGSYSNRIHKDNGEIFRLSTPTVYESCGGPGGTTSEDELMWLLQSDWMQPYPKFYNIEEQYVFESKNKGVFVGDFLYDYNDIPTYRMDELVDNHTKVAVIEMPDINKLINVSFNESIAAEGYLHEEDNPVITFENGLKLELEELKNHITFAFIKINQYVIDSVFSQVDVIIDIENGTFNVMNETLRTKYRELNKKEILDEYLLLVSKISSLVDNLFGEQCGDTQLYKLNMLPNRLTIHISNTGCKMKLTNTKKLIVNSNGATVPLSAKSESSASDTDELVCIECSDAGCLGYYGVP